MAAKPLVSIISKKLIRPSSPTPTSLACHKLSIIDQSLSNMYLPLSLWYPNGSKALSETRTQLSQLLENSLSRILTSYYPYAGRLKNNYTVDCNDKGAEFIEVNIECPILEILNNRDLSVEDIVFPNGLPWKDSYKDGISTVAQVSSFSCGGIAISTCMTHKIGDGYSACRFISDWAEQTRCPSAKASPHFVQESIFPPHLDGPLVTPVLNSEREECVQKKFVFSGPKLFALKETVAAKSGVSNPTRTEVVSALLYKCATAAAKLDSGAFKPSSLAIDIDVRGMIVPSLPPNSIGNMLSTMSITTMNEYDMNLPKLVGEIRKEKGNVKVNDLVLDIEKSSRNGQRLLTRADCDTYYCSSLCKFPLYDIDFGLGKPTRAIIPNGPYKNFFFLMDDKSGGGVEALVMLKEEHMSHFENDQELLKFASPVLTN